MHLTGTYVTLTSLYDAFGDTRRSTYVKCPEENTIRLLVGSKQHGNLLVINTTSVD